MDNLIGLSKLELDYPIIPIYCSIFFRMILQHVRDFIGKKLLPFASPEKKWWQWWTMMSPSSGSSASVIDCHATKRWIGFKHLQMTTDSYIPPPRLWVMMRVYMPFCNEVFQGMATHQATIKSRGLLKDSRNKRLIVHFQKLTSP